jgi:predicted P-loop ATPase
MTLKVASETPNHELFKEQIRKVTGFAPQEIIEGGTTWQHFSTDPRNPNDGGGYYLFHGWYGVFGDWRTSVLGTPLNHYWWSSKRPTPEQRKERERIQRDLDAKRDADYATAAERYKEEFEKASEDYEDHPYLLNKDIRVEGLRRDGQKLLVPLYNGAGELTTLQRIDVTRTPVKQLAKGGLARGGRFYMGDIVDRVIVAEGLATGASLFNSLDIPTVIAFNASNLTNVVADLRKKYPLADIIIAVDDDESKTGITAARAAAKEAGAKLSLPPFDRAIYADKKQYNDWNDYALKFGQDRIREVFETTFVENYETDWKFHAVKNKDVIVCNIASVTAALTYSKELKNFVAVDKMLRDIIVQRSIPGLKVTERRPLVDEDITKVTVWLQKNGLTTVTSSIVWEALRSYAMDNSYDSGVEFLDSLVWDGTPRLDSWLVTHLGAENKTYHRKIGAYFILSAIARLYSPGCKCDYMLILEGLQGLAKSTVIAVLGGKWFSDSLPSVSNEAKASQHLRGKWIIEIPELSALQKSEVERIKSFIARQEEKYRPPYLRVEVEEPRRCVFIGTTNQEAYLTDTTGNRRFWPVLCGRVDIDGVKAVREQLFAEAVVRYKKGERWWPTPEEEDEYFVKEQTARMVTDIWEETIAYKLVHKFNEWKESKDAKGKAPKVFRISPGTIAAEFLDLPVGNIGKSHYNRIDVVLKSLGWTRSKTKIRGKYPWEPPADWPAGWEDVEEPAHSQLELLREAERNQRLKAVDETSARNEANMRDTREDEPF